MTNNEWNAFLKGFMFGAGPRAFAETDLDELRRTMEETPGEALMRDHGIELAERGPTPCRGDGAGGCVNPAHEHAERGVVTGRDVDRRCSDCGLPCHLDRGDGRFYHDDPEALDCRLLVR